MQPLGSFKVTEVEHSDIDVQTVVIFEWPSLADVEKFQEDERWVKNLPTRDRLFNDLHVIYFQVTNDAVITFEPDGLYEFAGFWINKKNGKLMPQYFEKMGPLIQQAQVRPLAQIEVVDTSSRYALTPDKFNFLQWGAGHAARDHIFESQEFKDNGYMRALALDRLLTIMITPEK